MQVMPRSHFTALRIFRACSSVHKANRSPVHALLTLEPAMPYSDPDMRRQRQKSRRHAAAASQRQRQEESAGDGQCLVRSYSRNDPTAAASVSSQEGECDASRVVVVCLLARGPISSQPVCQRARRVSDQLLQFHACRRTRPVCRRTLGTCRRTLSTCR